MTFFVIRHKATGQLMPLMRRGRGYSWWNPSNPNAHGVAERLALKVPRLLISKEQAQRCIVAWRTMLNSRNDIDGDIIIVKQDDRKITDLEVLKVELKF